MARSHEVVFGEVLEELRRAREYSQEVLSFEAGRGRTYVSDLERGRSSPTLRTLWAIARALDTTPSEIVRRVEDEAF